jgi:hypothetical protein
MSAENHVKGEKVIKEGGHGLIIYVVGSKNMTAPK